MMVASDNNWLNIEYCHASEMHQEHFFFTFSTIAWRLISEKC